MPKITLPLSASRLAQQNLVSTARVGLVFTYTLGLDSEGNDPGANAPSVTPGRGEVVKVDQNGKVAKELVVGAGWKSVRIEQSINTTQENALGWFNIVETIEHNVASNTMTASKMMMRWGMLANIGLVPWGSDILISPLVNCYIFDPKELIQGNNVGYLLAERLHIQQSSNDFTSGQTVMENVTFRPNNIRRVDNPIPEGLTKRLKQLFPGLTSDLEGIDTSFTFNGV